MLNYLAKLLEEIVILNMSWHMSLFLMKTTVASDLCFPLTALENSMPWVVKCLLNTQHLRSCCFYW